MNKQICHYSSAHSWKEEPNFLKKRSYYFNEQTNISLVPIVRVKGKIKCITIPHHVSSRNNQKCHKTQSYQSNVQLKVSLIPIILLHVTTECFIITHHKLQRTI